ncbi:MAG TPA: hypothetical protein VGF07_01990 [Stellaceae bacterium]|jgi:hypothetical protein
MLSANQYSRTYGAMVQELRPDFFMDTIEDRVASNAAGRPIYREIERVRIIIPGAVATISVKNVSDIERNRWPEAYAAFKSGQEAPITGTPIEEWPVLNRAMVGELRHLEIRTVEELARLSDVQVQRIGMGGTILRERARAFLDDSAHEALTSKTIAENDLLRSRIVALERQVDELGRQLLTLDHQARALADRRPGFQTYVPGDEEAVHPGLRQPYPAEPPASPPSAFDDLAARPFTGRPRRGLVNFDPAADEDTAPGEAA